MKPSKRAAKPFLGMIAAVLLLLMLSAFTFPSTRASAHGRGTPQHTGYKILPGQEIIIPAPTKDDPKFTMHLKLTMGASVPFSSLKPGERAGIQIPASAPCRPVGESWAGYSVLGIQLWAYSISFTFCWQNGLVTYISSIHPSVSTLWPWGVSHHEYSAQEKTWGYGGGNYTASTPVQSHSGFAEVDVYSDGSANGYGA